MALVMRQILLALALVSCVASVSPGLAAAEGVMDSHDCSDSAFTARANQILAEAKAINAESPPEQLAALLTDAKTSGEAASNCRQQFIGTAAYGPTMVILFANEQIQVEMLERLGRYQEAEVIAAAAPAAIAEAEETAFPTMTPQVIANLTQVSTWMQNAAPRIAAELKAGDLPQTYSNVVAACHGMAPEPRTSLSSTLSEAQCLGQHGKRADAITLIRSALHSGPRTDDKESLARTYAALALYEDQSGQLKKAIAHITEAFYVSRDQDDAFRAEIDDDFRKIAPTTYKALQAKIEAQTQAEAQASYAAQTEGMSADQRRVFDEEGPADHVETFDAAGIHEETWWYNSPEGGYRAGYTFYNGVLHSIFRP